MSRGDEDRLSENSMLELMSTPVHDTDSGHSPLERWLEAALAGASTEEVRDEDGVLVGWWAENPECAGASAFGSTPDEARSKLREVLSGWFELGRQLGHPIPSLHEDIVVTPA